MWDHTVQPGESLRLISQRFHKDYFAILRLNPQIADKNRIFAGQVVHMPDPRPVGIVIPGAITVIPPAKIFDDSIPPRSPAAGWDSRLQETYRRSYRKRTATNKALQDGLGPGPSDAPPTIPLGEVIHKMGAHNEYISAVFNAALRVTGLSDFIDILQYSWSGTSVGFKFVATDRDALQVFAERRNDFCRDNRVGGSMHQDIPRHTYRQVVPCGAPGLHICVVRTNAYPADAGENELHIDFHQIASKKLPVDLPIELGNGNCVYCAGELASHWRDVGPWIYDQKVKPKLQKIMDVAKSNPLTLAEINAILKASSDLSQGVMEIEKLAVAMYRTLRDIRAGVLTKIENCSSPRK